jgi:Zn-dependent protease
MTGSSLLLALYVAAALVPALVLHEYAHAFVATRLGDPTPKRWGRLTLNPKPMIDPFGSLILPALSLILIATGNGLLIPIFAYAKPMPLDPNYLKNRDRDTIVIWVAGLAMNLALAIVGGILVRAGAGGELLRFSQAWVVTNALMFGFQLMPIPGLDGAKLLARALPLRAREVFVNLEQYLVLFILVVFFLLAGPLQAIVGAFANVVCRIASGADCSL